MLVLMGDWILGFETSVTVCNDADSIGAGSTVGGDTTAMGGNEAVVPRCTALGSREKRIGKHLQIF